MDVFYLAATSTQEGSTSGLLVLFLFLFIITIFAIAGLWKTFVKAGQPGWAAIVPIYNTYVLIKIAGQPDWWLLLYFIPFVNIIISLLVAIEVAKKFGKSEVFGVFGLWLFAFVGYLMLGFGDATYHGGAESQSASSAANPPSKTTA